MNSSDHKASKGAQRARYVIADWVSGNLAFFAFNIIRYVLLNEHKHGFGNLWSFLFSEKLIIEQAVVPVGMLCIYWLSGYYNIPFGKSRLQEMLTTFFSSIINTILIYLILLINDQTGKRTVNYEMIIMLFGLLFVIPYIFRIFITSFALRNFKRHSWEIKVLVIGNTKSARDIADRLEKGPSRVGYKVVGFIEIEGKKTGNHPKKGIPVYPFSKIEEVIREQKAEQLIISPENLNDKQIMGILIKLFPLQIPVKISPDTLSFVTSAIRMRDIWGEPFIDLTSPSLSESSKNIKRVADILISGCVLIILSPLYLALSIWVKAGSKGPIFYSQERIGLRQKPFRIYKFRSMVTDAEKNGPALSSDADSRITPVGRVMRKYRLDELPQFWNVLKGEMSIVGPRPEREFFIRQIVEKAPYYVLVYQVRPGITSWGMVKYGYASDIDQMVERTRYDLIYMANMSLFVDAKILVYTVKTVITGKGI